MRTSHRSNREEKIKAIAQGVFDCHEIEQLSSGRVRQWRCGRPGTVVYEFTVTTWPGTLVITGDLGHLAVQQCDDMISWCRGAVRSIDYFAEKVPQGIQVTEFDRDVAMSVLREVIDGSDDFDLCDNLRDLLADCEWAGADISEGEFYQRLYESGAFDYCDAPSAHSYTSDFLWRRQALMWFLDHLKEDANE